MRESKQNWCKEGTNESFPESRLLYGQIESTNNSNSAATSFIFYSKLQCKSPEEYQKIPTIVHFASDPTSSNFFESFTMNNNNYNQHPITVQPRWNDLGSKIKLNESAFHARFNVLYIDTWLQLLIQPTDIFPFDIPKNTKELVQSQFDAISVFFKDFFMQDLDKPERKDERNQKKKDKPKREDRPIIFLSSGGRNSMYVLALASKMIKNKSHLNHMKFNGIILRDPIFFSKDFILETMFQSPVFSDENEIRKDQKKVEKYFEETRKKKEIPKQKDAPPKNPQELKDKADVQSQLIEKYTPKLGQDEMLFLKGKMWVFIHFLKTFQSGQLLLSFGDPMSFNQFNKHALSRLRQEFLKEGFLGDSSADIQKLLDSNKGVFIFKSPSCSMILSEGITNMIKLEKVDKSYVPLELSTVFRDGLRSIEQSAKHIVLLFEFQQEDYSTMYECIFIQEFFAFYAKSKNKRSFFNLGESDPQKTQKPIKNNEQIQGESKAVDDEITSLIKEKDEKGSEDQNHTDEKMENNNKKEKDLRDINESECTSTDKEINEGAKGRYTKNDNEELLKRFSEKKKKRSKSSLKKQRGKIDILDEIFNSTDKIIKNIKRKNQDLKKEKSKTGFLDKVVNLTEKTIQNISQDPKKEKNKTGLLDKVVNSTEKTIQNISRKLSF